MKKNILLTVSCLVFSFTLAFSQGGLYYYGYKTKYPLKVDSGHAIIVPLTETAALNRHTLSTDSRIAYFTPITNRKEVLVTLRDTAMLNNVAIDDYTILPIFYVGTRPLRPTGEIVFRPKAGISYKGINEYTGGQIQHLRTKKHGVHVVRPINPQRLLEIANQIYESGLVEWCEPNFLVEIEKHQTTNPTDPLYPQQYYLNQGNNIDINAPQAWGISVGMCPVRVAVIDDGVETHEDLVGGWLPVSPLWTQPVLVRLLSIYPRLMKES